MINGSGGIVLKNTMKMVARNKDATRTRDKSLRKEERCIDLSVSTTTSVWSMSGWRHAVRSHTPGRIAHHSGCSGIEFTPRACIRNDNSCRRGRAVSTPALPVRGVPSGRVAPVQNTSADVAARGQMMESRLEGDDCSVQSSCSPGSKKEVRHRAYNFENVITYHRGRARSALRKDRQKDRTNRQTAMS